MLKYSMSLITFTLPAIGLDLIDQKINQFQQQLDNPETYTKLVADHLQSLIEFKKFLNSDATVYPLTIDGNDPRSAGNITLSFALSPSPLDPVEPELLQSLKQNLSANGIDREIGRVESTIVPGLYWLSDNDNGLIGLSKIIQ